HTSDFSDPDPPPMASCRDRSGSANGAPRRAASPGGDACPRSCAGFQWARGRPAVIVVQPDDIVFPEIIALLNLDDLKRHGAGIFEPMRGFFRDDRALIRLEIEHA